MAPGVASAVCLGLIAASCNNHGMGALNLFMPSEAPLPLAALLVLIETFAVFSSHQPVVELIVAVVQGCIYALLLRFYLESMV